MKKIILVIFSVFLISCNDSGRNLQNIENRTDIVRIDTFVVASEPLFCGSNFVINKSVKFKNSTEEVSIWQSSRESDINKHKLITSVLWADRGDVCVLGQKSNGDWGFVENITKKEINY